MEREGGGRGGRGEREKEREREREREREERGEGERVVQREGEREKEVREREGGRGDIRLREGERRITGEWAAGMSEGGEMLERRGERWEGNEEGGRDRRQSLAGLRHHPPGGVSASAVTPRRGVMSSRRAG